MKYEKILLTIMVSLICFASLLSFQDAMQRVKINVKYPYDLSENYLSFTIEKEMKDDTLNHLFEICKEEKITILLENSLEKRLGIFDISKKYTENVLFFGSYFSEDDFLKKQQKAIILAKPDSQEYESEVMINNKPYEIIGEYMEDYILSNGKYEVIYPLFSLDDITGKYYIDCDNKEALNKVVNVFKSEGYDIVLKQAHIGIIDALSYISQDKQFTMIFFVFILILISLAITEYAIANRQLQLYHVQYLVGNSYKRRLFHELLMCSLRYMIAVVTSLGIYYVFMNCISLIEGMEIGILVALLLIIFILLVSIHMIIFIILQHKSKEGIR